MKTRHDFTWPPNCHWINEFSPPYSMEYFQVNTQVNVKIMGPSIEMIHSLVSRIYVWEAEQMVERRKNELLPKES